MALSDGLVGYWSPWSGSSGYRLLDRTRYANHGTLTNMDAGTDWVGATIQGRSGYALDFDGTNDVVLHQSGSLATNTLSVSCWFNPKVLTRGDVFTCWTNGQANSQFNMLYGLTSGKIRFYITDGTLSGIKNSGDSATTMTTNVFYHAVGTYNKSTLALYVNGKLEASTSQTINLNTSSLTAIRFGNNQASDGQLNGQVADGCYWNRVLTSSEILELYRLGPGWYRPYAKRSIGYAVAGFKAYWHRRQSQVIGGGLR